MQIASIPQGYDCKGNPLKNLETKYTSIDEYLNEHLGILSDYYGKAFKSAEIISVMFGTSCPYISIYMGAVVHDDKGGLCFGKTYTPDECNLDNQLIVIFLASILTEADRDEEIEDLLFTCTIAHEMRHVYQKENGILTESIRDNISLYDAAEIDADAFGIYFGAKVCGTTLDESAIAFCDFEHSFDPITYNFRVLIAKELKPLWDYKATDAFKIISRKYKGNKGILSRLIDRLRRR